MKRPVPPVQPLKSVPGRRAPNGGPLKLLWAVSSVGLGHVMRDLAIVAQLHRKMAVEVDWLAPPPAGDFLRQKGCTVLPQSEQLAGSGRLYADLFADCTDNFNLMPYAQADARLHRHDFGVSAPSWQSADYAALVGDEAFWLLTGFASGWSPKPAPFIFLTDFIGTKAMTSHLGERLQSWYQNLRFTFSHRGPDRYLYIGSEEEIPDEPLGRWLPHRRAWALRHCQFVKPIVSFAPEGLSDKASLRRRLGLPQDGHLFLATVGPHGNPHARTAYLERVFDILRHKHPEAVFLLVCPEKGLKPWIQYQQHLELLYEYFGASDFVLTQSGYGKVTELLALGVPFVAIPLDYHFEQENFMAHRLHHYGIGELMTLRDHPPEAMAATAELMMAQPWPKIRADNGTEVADLILQTTGA